MLNWQKKIKKYIIKKLKKIDKKLKQKINFLSLKKLNKAKFSKKKLKKNI